MLKRAHQHQTALDFDELAIGPAPQLPLEAFQARRERLLDQVETPLLVATNPETTYSRDVHNRFRPHSDFWYLTGFAEPGAAILLADGKSTLFCRPRDAHQEVWNGRRVGLERAKDALGVDAVKDINDLAAHFEAGTDLLAIIEHDSSVAETVGNRAGDIHDGSDLLAEMRVIKEPAEIAMLQKACDVGASAMAQAISEIKPGVHEYELEATLLDTYRRAGSTGPGYPAIVGTGANASILHYVENRSQVKAGEMVLIDAGCEWGYYNSDITRTIPSDGWSEQHGKLYDLVWEAQQAALAQVRPGETLASVHEAASTVLAQGFADLGWIDGDVEAAMAAGEHKRYYMHGTSHFLGLDVHDVGRYKVDGETRKLQPGMVITVEPGLYLNPDFAKLPAGFDPLGIRIENDVVVTDNGHLDLLAGLPTDREGLDLLHNG